MKTDFKFNRLKDNGIIALAAKELECKESDITYLIPDSNRETLIRSGIHKGYVRSEHFPPCFSDFPNQPQTIKIYEVESPYTKKLYKYLFYCPFPSDLIFNTLLCRTGELHKILQCLHRNQDNKNKLNIHKPILSDKIYERTIGNIETFLRNRSKYKELGCTLNKGLLLWGKPGNGKSLITQYIYGKYSKRFSVKFQSIKNFMNEAPADINIFDDVEVEVLGRKSAISDELLSYMDGKNKGLQSVFIMTTNMMAGNEDINRAFIRPGRLDTIVKIDSPGLEMRTKFINTWHPNLQIDREALAKSTDGFSFAELDYVKELAAKQFIDKGVIDMVLCMKEYRERKEESNKYLGFRSVSNKLMDDNDGW